MKSKLLFALAIAAFSGSSFAADVAAGKAKAGVCAGCHGPEGISLIPMYPNLAGQKSAYLVKQLKDFKEKRRVDPIMAAQAAMLSDADIENVAAYFEGLSKK